MAFEPDIIVASRDDSDFLLVVETKRSSTSPEQLGRVQEQLKQYMFGMRSALGLLITPDKIWVLKDTYRSYTPDSIDMIGEFDLPPIGNAPDAFPIGGRLGPDAEFEARVQHWIESLRAPAGRADLPGPLRAVLEEHVVPVLEVGDVRAAHHRVPAARASDGR